MCCGHERGDVIIYAYGFRMEPTQAEVIQAHIPPGCMPRVFGVSGMMRVQVIEGDHTGEIFTIASTTTANHNNDNNRS